MIVTRAELAKQGLEPRVIGKHEEILKIIKDYYKNNTKEARIYKETELEDGINPDIYYLFVRE